MRFCVALVKANSPITPNYKTSLTSEIAYRAYAHALSAHAGEFSNAVTVIRLSGSPVPAERCHQSVPIIMHAPSRTLWDTAPYIYI